MNIKKSIAFITLLLFCNMVLLNTQFADVFTSSIVASADDSGSCGANCTYTFDSSAGTLTISGNGAMTNYSSDSKVPWYDYRDTIKNVVIKDGVTSISGYAFYGCTSLMSVIIPNSVTYITKNAFYSCTSLVNIYYTGSEDDWNAIVIGSGWDFVSDWDNFTIHYNYIEENYSGSCGTNCTYTFDSSTDTLTISGNGAMTNYSSDSKVPWYDYRDTIKNVVIEEGITSIGRYAFFNCTSLTSITIPNSVTSIGDFTFECCSSLTSITVPNSITSIGNSAFLNCTSLASITIPDVVTSISNGAFYNCISLTSITIPNGVTSISDYAFYNCTNLTDVYYDGTEDEWNKIAIGLQNSYLTDATIHYNSNVKNNTITQMDSVKEKYTSLTSFIGDINNDYNINIIDLIMLKEALFNKRTLDDDQKTLADLDNNGTIDCIDLLLLKKYILGITKTTDSTNAYYNEHLVLWVENSDLEYNTTTNINLHIRIPTTWDKSNVSIYKVNEDNTSSKILTYAFNEFTLYEEDIYIGDYAYNDYMIKIPFKDNGDNDVNKYSFSIYAETDDDISNSVTLYRNIEVSEDVIERACNILDELAQYIDTLSKMKEYPTYEEVLSSVAQWLENRDDIAYISQSNETIFFTTVDGFNSFFSLEEDDVTDTELSTETNVSTVSYNSSNVSFLSLNTASTSNGSFTPTTNVDELYKEKFVFDNNFKSTVIDPDVLTMCPILTVDYNCKRYSSTVQKAETLCSYLNGQLVNLEDIDCTSWDVFQSWQDYGTIILNTHGVMFNDRICFTIAGINSTEYASTVFDSLVGNSSDLETIFGTDKDSKIFKEAYFMSNSNSNSQARFGFSVLYNKKLQYYYSINLSSDYFMYRYSDIEFPNTIFYFCVCHSFEDTKFNQFLIDHGASGVFGFNSWVNVDTAYNLTNGVINKLMKSQNRTTHNYTAANAQKSQFKFSFGSKRYSYYGNVDFVYHGYGELSGQVVDQNNNPISDATVIAYRYYASNASTHRLIKEATVTTDSNGAYKFDNLTWGMYLIQAYNDVDESFENVSFAESSKGNIKFILNTPNEESSSRYEIFDLGKIGYDAAKEYCISLGGHLATITSKEENDYVYNLMISSGYKSAYFGLTDNEEEGTWKWVNGEPFSYSNWHSGEPNNENDAEDYAMFYYAFTDGTWNDGGFGKKYVQRWYRFYLRMGLKVI